MLPTMVIFATLVYLAIYWLILPVLRYVRDPKGLRRFENYSIFSGITDVPYCYLSACGFRSRDLTEAHKSSAILRIGPNSLSFGDIRAVRDIYGHSTSCVKDLKYAITGGPHPNLFDVVNKADHSAKRKRLSAAFAIKNLVQWEFKVAFTTKRLLNAFDKLCTQPLPTNSFPDPSDLTVDFNHWINLFTIEAINNIALSSTLGLLEKGDDLVTAQRMDGSTYQAHYRKAQNQSAFVVSHFVWDYGNFKLFSWISKLFPKWRRVWKDAEPWKDVIYHQAAGEPHNLEWGEIVGEIGAIIDAGADTTAIALTQLIDLLIRHPEHLETLRQEVDGVLTEDEIVAPYDTVKHLPFLRACLDEAMRVIPPTSAGLPRRTPPRVGWSLVNGYQVIRAYL
ncbi:hypothetical protein N7499_010754 [Penicillium canescens]|nr:hypothetical protein N7499_010754 [Penicillium canescens]